MGIVLSKPVFLIGFMGCGKSYWGQRIAEALNCPFLDLDTFIEDQTGQTIPRLFEAFGEAGFRERERQCLHQTAALLPGIVATGGGAPCFFDNMDWMNANGHTVYLQVPVPVLAVRLLPERAARPLLQAVPPEGLEAFIEERLALRRPFYEKAQTICLYDADGEVYADKVRRVFVGLVGGRF